MFCLPRFTHWLLASVAICLLLTPPAMAQKGKKPSSPVLTVSLSPTSVEVGGAVTGTVSHNTSTGSPVTVSLTSSIDAAVTMPASVTIIAEQSSASFAITAGATPQTVTITAAADGFQSGSASLTIAPPPPPGYEIKYIYVQVNGTEVAHIIPREANGMNNWGQAVGWYSLGAEQRAYLYDPIVTDDPNTIIGEAWDLTLLVDSKTVPSGFTIASAIDINDRGDIVGYLQPTGSGYSTRARKAYVMRRGVSGYALEVIDVDGRSMWGSRINEDGDVLCESYYDPDGNLFETSYVYSPDVGVGVLTELELPCGHLSDRLIDVDGFPMGPAAYGTIQNGSGGNTCHRILPWSGTFKQFDFDGVIGGVNGEGVFCGWAEVEVLVRKRYESQKIAYIWDGSLQQIGGGYTSAPAMNINKDALVFNFGNGRRDLAQLYHSDFGLQKLDDLVIGSNADLSYWFSASSITSRYLSDRSSVVSGEKEASHYGQIFGKVAVAGSDPHHRIFVLTPVGQ